MIDKKNNMTMHYYLRDHLGSVRVVTDGDGKAEQANHYYAFGGLLGTSFNGDKQKYKYNGKELDRFLNWDMLDYGARWMDSKLQCWSTVDPLAEKDPGISPYVYCRDNPVKYVDQDGSLLHYSLEKRKVSKISNKMPKSSGRTKDGRKIISNISRHGENSKTSKQRREIWYEQRKKKSLWDRLINSFLIPQK